MSRSDQLSSDNDDRAEVGEVERPRGIIDRLSTAGWMFCRAMGEVFRIARGGVTWSGPMVSWLGLDMEKG